MANDSKSARAFDSFGEYCLSLACEHVSGDSLRETDTLIRFALSFGGAVREDVYGIPPTVLRSLRDWSALERMEGSAPLEGEELKRAALSILERRAPEIGERARAFFQRQRSSKSEGRASSER